MTTKCLQATSLAGSGREAADFHQRSGALGRTVGKSDFFGAPVQLTFCSRDLRVERATATGHERRKSRSAVVNGLQFPKEANASRHESDANSSSVKRRPKAPPPSDMRSIVLFQAFNWESHRTGHWYDILRHTAGDLGDSGITDIWLPPPSHSVSPEGYLPAELYNLDASHYGSRQHLQDLIDEFHKAGIHVHADIVINHRSASEKDPRGKWAIFRGGKGDGTADWGPWALVREDEYGDGTGAPDTGAHCPYAPDLDHTNTRVQEDLTAWLKWLREEVGFDGWRLDFVKGYAPFFAQMYCDRTQPTFAVGELWTSLRYDWDWSLSYNQDPSRQELINWVNKTAGRCAAFDFTTKGVLQVALNHQLFRLKDREGRPPGMMGWYPERAVTFLENHDTGSTQRHWPFPSEKVMAGYAYILTHPGIPCVFYDHFYDWNLRPAIRDLILLRKRNGIVSTSPVAILHASDDLYVACINDNVILKLGPRFDMGGLRPTESEWQQVLSGHDYCVWERVKAPQKQGRRVGTADDAGKEAREREAALV